MSRAVQTTKTQIRLGICPVCLWTHRPPSKDWSGWTDAQVILLVLSCFGSFSILFSFINYNSRGIAKLTKWPAPSEYSDESRHDKNNKMSVRPVKTHISLGIRPVWSDSSLCAQWVGKNQAFSMWTVNTDQTGRLRWVHTHFVGFVMSRLRSAYISLQSDQSSLSSQGHKTSSCGQQRFWSDCTDTKAGLILLRYTSFALPPNKPQNCLTHASLINTENGS